jgi:hypothetical protein
MVVVVDAGRLHFLIGLAGEDSPDAGVPSHQSAYDASVFPCHGDEQALRERREANWALLEDYESGLNRPVYVGDDDDDDGDRTALFTATVFDAADSEHIRDVADRVFARGSKLRITHIHFALQELLILTASGRSTGLVINLGHDLTILGVFQGHMLGETARRVRMTASEDVFLSSAEEWERSMQLTALVTSAVMSAPIDTRRDLLRSVLVGGGRWGGWAGLAARALRRALRMLPGRRRRVRSTHRRRRHLAVHAHHDRLREPGVGRRGRRRAPDA